MVGSNVSAKRVIEFWMIGEVKSGNEAVFAIDSDDSRTTEAGKARDKVRNDLTRKITGLVSKETVEYTLPARFPDTGKTLRVPLLSKVVVDAPDAKPDKK